MDVINDMFIDIHLHSTFSPDGTSTMEEYCLKAINKGITILCFTEHVDYTVAEKNLDQTKDNRKQNFNIIDYFKEINRLKLKYPSLEILSGIEFSEPHLFPEEFSVYSSLPFDYILAAIHHCNNSVFPGAKNLPENQAIFEYYDLMLQSISSYSFQAMAHLDFPRRYFDSWEIPEKTINSILELMIKKEILLEINTSSISNDCTEPLPSYNIIKKYIELGGKKVVLGSDAHNCSFLGNGYDCIRKNLPLELEIGYFKNREFVGINSNTFE